MGTIPLPLEGSESVLDSAGRSFVSRLRFLVGRVNFVKDLLGLLYDNPSCLMVEVRDATAIVRLLEFDLAKPA
jgi:hypothetical protein